MKNWIPKNGPISCSQLSTQRHLSKHWKTIGYSFLLVFVGTILSTKSALADDDNRFNLAAATKGRCANRIGVSLTGKPPSAELTSAQDPQSVVDTILKSPDFIEQFARFFNARSNVGPGATPAEDASYHLAKHILTVNEPWKNLFVGAYDIVAAGTAAAPTITVQANPNGLGYFRNKVWMDRYAGNEQAGIKLNTAYRMMNNTVGLELIATTNAPGADVSANGRRSGSCKGCHYEGWYALDINASVLSKVTRTGNNVTYTPPDGQPKAVLGGLMIKDDKEFVTALVDSEAFSFNACRLAFSYLYGRNENQCEAELFDKCVDAFKSSGLIQTALATIAKDPSFCN